MVSVESANKRTQKMFILEAMFEYFISIIVTGAYIAKIGQNIGMSDGLIGIVTSIGSLTCTFQLVAVLLSYKRPLKKWVLILHLLNQTIYAFIFFVPVFPLPKTYKILALIAFSLSGHILASVISPAKITFFMNSVEKDKRGLFTANKEIVSLLSGMAFSFVINYMIDRFEDQGQIGTAFIICGIAVFALTICHALTVIFSKETEIPVPEEKLGESLKSLFKDKTLWKITGISIIWHFAQNMTLPFMYNYTIKTIDNGGLGYSMTMVTVSVVMYAITRSLISRKMGKLGDKITFVRLLKICYIIEIIAFIFYAFTRPESRYLYYVGYAILGVSAAGTNSSNINLVYENIAPSKVTAAYAVRLAVGGLVGFLTTTITGLFINYVNASGNVFLGMQLYATQITSIFSIIGLIGLLLFVHFAFPVKKKEKISE